MTKIAKIIACVMLIVGMALFITAIITDIKYLAATGSWVMGYSAGSLMVDTLWCKKGEGS